MSRPDRALTPAELNAFGAELDAIRDRVIAELGAKDTRYIRRVAAAVRWSGVLGRLLLFVGAFSPLFWSPLLWPACIRYAAAGAVQDPGEHGAGPQRDAWPV